MHGSEKLRKKQFIIKKHLYFSGQPKEKEKGKIRNGLLHGKTYPTASQKAMNPESRTWMQV